MTSSAVRLRLPAHRPRTALHGALIALVALSATPLGAQPASMIPERYREVANRIIEAAQADSTGAWDR